ncbi:M24 family metallopeptidase [Cohnella hashimotonis]|uniref:Xaa-Pro peptidase family protein n=1 Tax=Cohnella hashimotonis TaxID=2826895 RepID=A0ABT6TCZ8_9BACL|nr:Xaa-Pro peptidase family protein [Cohnella hashimotonis]MDI4644446.1 Xaa-Pro peptidase family protein [Cohnella hashimotonis]
MIKIPKAEFAARIEKLKALMRENDMQACLIYGDEYRKENLRYMSNYWPLFERGAVMVSMTGEPFVIAAPEGEMFCREMSAWPDVRLLPEFACVTVPDKIEYPQAHYTSLTEICKGLQESGPLQRLGIVGIDAMPEPLMKIIGDSFAGIELVDAGELLFQLRMTKTANEVACLQEAARIADAGYKLMIEQVKPGMTELELASLAYGECIRQGAENVPFCLLTSGDRVNTIIGRASGKVIEDGDMIMAAIAVQVEGYVATLNFPFVAGQMREEQKKFIDILVEAEDAALSRIKAGAGQSEVVRAVKACFKDRNVTEYDLYPPLHGCGLAEAESPYPDENTEAKFVAGMTVNTDVSLFGHPHGSNRIEESLLVTEDGYESMSKLVRHLSRTWKETATISVD